VRRTFVIKGCCQSAYWRPLRNCYQLLRAGMPSPAPLGAWVIDKLHYKKTPNFLLFFAMLMANALSLSRPTKDIMPRESIQE
jgi:hypothetical protein